LGLTGGIDAVLSAPHTPATRRDQAEIVAQLANRDQVTDSKKINTETGATILRKKGYTT
jgi:hypothetical protein